MENVRCEWVRRFLGPWQDGELDPGVAARIETHVDSCESCAAHARFETWFSGEIRRVAERPVAPERLAERVSAALRAEERNRRSRRIIVGLSGLAAAATLAIVWAAWVRDVPTPAGSSSAGDSVASAEAGVGGGGAPSLLSATPVSSSPVLASAGAEPLIADVLDRHSRAVLRTLPLELTTRDVRAASTWFADKVAFPVTAPHFAGRDIRLVGGRLTHVRDADAAYLRYDAGSRPVSLIVFPARGHPIGGDAVHEIGGLRVYTGRRAGYNYAVFTVGDLAYALTSDLPADRLLELAGGIIGSRLP